MPPREKVPPRSRGTSSGSSRSSGSRHLPYGLNGACRPPPILAADEVPGETSPLIGDAYPAALADAATELSGLVVEEG